MGRQTWKRKRQEKRQVIDLKKLRAALLRSFWGQHGDKIICARGSARGNWDPREGQPTFQPNQNRVEDHITTLVQSTLSRFILWILSVSRNPILIHLSLSRSRILCFAILALTLNDRYANGGIIIFDRQGLSFSELSNSPLSSLDPYSDYMRVNISLNNSSSLFFLNVNAPSIRSSWRAESIPFPLYSSLLQKLFHSG